MDEHLSILFQVLVPFQVITLFNKLPPATQQVILDHLLHTHMCVSVNSNLFIYFACRQRLKALAEGKRHPRDIVGSHCLPHPSRTQSPKTIQPWDPSLLSLQRNDSHGMRGIESAYVSIFTVFTQLFELQYIGELQGSGFFFLIHSHLIPTHIDVYMLYFRNCSCTDYDRKWSIIPRVTQQVLGAYFLSGSVHMSHKYLICMCPTPFFSANSKGDKFLL